MNDRQRALIRQSFASLGDVAGPVSMLFYGRLFDLDRRIRTLFPDDLKAQGQKLMSMFDSLIRSLDDFDELKPKLRELGRQHVEYGVRSEHYDTLADAFLWAIGHALDGGFDHELKDAWAELIRAISHEMMAGAAEQPPSAT